MNNLLQDPGKNSLPVQIKINTLNLTENVQVLPNLMKNSRIIFSSDGYKCSWIGITGTISGYWLLQDHEARSFPFPVSPFPVQVPADQKARLEASTHDQQRVWIIHKHKNTCMMTNHALMIYFYPQDMQAGTMHVQACEEVILSIRFSTNLMLHSDPELIHFCEILEYKFNSIHDSVCISARGRKFLTEAHSSIWTTRDNWTRGEYK